jgi:large subunit ribosomal protein L10
MPREKKVQAIDRLQEGLIKCNIGILTDYRGLPTSEMAVLRGRLREIGVEYKVVKNTLARFAATRAGKDDLVNSIEGPLAIAFGYGDITAPAKVLASYIRDSKSIMSIKGGLLGDKLLTTEDVMTLSTLPSREVLVARVLGHIKSPVSALVGCLSHPLRGFMGILQARIRQLEGE